MCHDPSIYMYRGACIHISHSFIHMCRDSISQARLEIVHMCHNPCIHKWHGLLIHMTHMCHDLATQARLEIERDMNPSKQQAPNSLPRPELPTLNVIYTNIYTCKYIRIYMHRYICIFIYTHIFIYMYI